MTDLNTEYEYNKEIVAIAKCIVEEAYIDYTDVTNREEAEELINDTLLHETIDGHQWVIYYRYNLPVLEYSHNTYYADEQGLIGENPLENGLNSFHTMLAFWAMYADVQEELESALDKWDSEHEEDSE